MGHKRNWRKTSKKKKATIDFLRYLETIEKKETFMTPGTIFGNGFNAGWKEGKRFAKRKLKDSQSNDKEKK